MPDQSAAASEHALIQEITGPLSTLSDDAVAITADVEFPIVLRGYDRIAVDAYVRKTSQLVAELRATRSPEAAVRRALERVGEQISGILQRAHETAETITAQSRADAEDRLEVARREAAEILTAAQARLKDLDQDTDRIWDERHRIVDDARELASQLTGIADAAAARFPGVEEGPAATNVPADDLDPGTGELYDGEAPAGEDPDDDEVTERFVADDLAAEPAAEPGPPSIPQPVSEHGPSPTADPVDPDATAVLPPLRFDENDPPPDHAR